MIVGICACWFATPQASAKSFEAVNEWHVAAPGAIGNDTSCDPCETIQGALSKSLAVNGKDDIVLGEGTYYESVIISNANPVNLIGAGMEKTTIQVFAGLTTLTLMNGSVNDLTLKASDGNVVNLQGGDLVRVKVTATEPAADSYAGVVVGGGGTDIPEIIDSEISLPAGDGINTTTGITFSGPTLTAYVRNSGITADNAFVPTMGSTLVGTALNVVGRNALVTDLVGGTVILGSSLLTVNSDEGPFTLSPNNDPGTVQTSTLTLLNNTINISVPSLNPAIFASIAEANDAVTIDINSTAFVGFTHPMSLQLNADGTFTTTVKYSLFDETAVLTSGSFASPQSPTYTGNIVANDLLFRNAANGDFRLRRGSPLIDTGVVDDMVNQESADLRGLVTVRDGNADADARRDIGAYEFQPAPTSSRKPRVLGSLRPHTRAKCTLGTWQPGTDATFKYSWFRGNKKLADTGKFHKMRPQDRHRKLSCRVTATTADEASTAKSKRRLAA